MQLRPVKKSSTKDVDVMTKKCSLVSNSFKEYEASCYMLECSDTMSEQEKQENRALIWLVEKGWTDDCINKCDPVNLCNIKDINIPSIECEEIDNSCITIIKRNKISVKEKESEECITSCIKVYDKNN